MRLRVKMFVFSSPGPACAPVVAAARRRGINVRVPCFNPGPAKREEAQ